MQHFIDYMEVDVFEKHLIEYLEMQEDREIIVMCIGTNKLIGDAFGPIVGQLLKNKCSKIYGSLNYPITAKNLEKRYAYIQNRYVNPYVIVIDSALGKKELLGKLVIGNGGIYPGSALNKKLNKIGDMYINAVVGDVDNNSYEELKSADIYQVIGMAKTVATCIMKYQCI